MQAHRRQRLLSRRLIALAVVGILGTGNADVWAQGARDRDNPTCPGARNYGNSETMNFRLDLSGGRRVLIAEGRIGRNDAERLRLFIATHLPIDEIWMRSPGGVAIQGPAIGDVIRRFGIPTRVPAGWWCVSACNFAFLGGPIRVIEAGGVYAVHMFTVVNNSGYVDDLKRDHTYGDLIDRIARNEQSSAMVAAEQNDFLIRMGVSRKLLTEVMYKQKAHVVDDADRSTIRCLTREEMRRYNIANVD